MVMLGVVGEYTGRIYYEAKRRPHFLVKASNVQDAAAVPRRTRRPRRAGRTWRTSPKTTRKNLVP